MRTHNEIRPNVTGEVTSQIARVLELGDVTLREMDLDDVMLSKEASRVLGRASGTILRNYVPHPSMIPGLMNEVMQAYHEQVFWVEETGLLIIRIKIMGDEHYLQISQRHWRVNKCQGHCH